MTNRKIDYWVIPPQADGEFVANMDEVLETYAPPDDSAHPVICMDEQPIQLLKDTRVPIAATKNHPRRVDYEYERAGNNTRLWFGCHGSRYSETRVFQPLREHRSRSTATCGTPIL